MARNQKPALQARQVEKNEPKMIKLDKAADEIFEKRAAALAWHRRCHATPYSHLVNHTSFQTTSVSEEFKNLNSSNQPAENRTATTHSDSKKSRRTYLVETTNMMAANGSIFSKVQLSKEEQAPRIECSKRDCAEQDLDGVLACCLNTLDSGFHHMESRMLSHIVHAVASQKNTSGDSTSQSLSHRIPPDPPHGPAVGSGEQPSSAQSATKRPDRVEQRFFNGRWSDLAPAPPNRTPAAVQDAHTHSPPPPLIPPPPRAGAAARSRPHHQPLLLLPESAQRARERLGSPAPHRSDPYPAHARPPSPAAAPHPHPQGPLSADPHPHPARDPTSAADARLQPRPWLAS